MNKKDLQTAIHAALRAWGDLTGSPTNLLEDLLFVQAERKKANHNTPSTRRLATNQVLLIGIEALKRQNHIGAKILSLRFMDGDTVLMVGNKLDMSEDQVKRAQREAIHSLTQIVWEQEIDVREKYTYDLQAQLMPADYTELFGIDEQSQALLTHLQPHAVPWIIVVFGIGGIGKTALADAATRKIIRQFIYQKVVWLQVDPTKTAAPQETLEILLTELSQKLGIPDVPNVSIEEQSSQLRQVLKSIPCLVVIDNLESDEEAAFIVKKISNLTNPSKFLLTSRERLPASASIFNLSLSELSANDALQLIRQQAHMVGLMDLARAGDEKLLPIYEIIGGNPLAILLVIGLSTVLPLPHILTDLKEAKINEIEQLYRHIYWQTWHNLNKNSQTLLEMMPLISAVGANLEQLSAMSSLDDKQLFQAITELVARSLVEVRGTAWMRRYAIHRLTESFLRSEIIHWPKR